jgi:hypothetical protein
MSALRSAEIGKIVWNMHNIGKNLPRSNARGLEAAMERDRRFFARHPFVSEYTREIMPGEFPSSEMPPGCEAHGVVVVRQITPGVRFRFLKPDFFIVMLEQQR